MPKEITPLSELKVNADGTLDVDETAVGGCSGLSLYTQPAGTKTWVL